MTEDTQRSAHLCSLWRRQVPSIQGLEVLFLSWWSGKEQDPLLAYSPKREQNIKILQETDDLSDTCGHGCKSTDWMSHEDVGSETWPVWFSLKSCMEKMKWREVWAISKEQISTFGDSVFASKTEGLKAPCGVFTGKQKRFPLSVSQPKCIVCIFEIQQTCWMCFLHHEVFVHVGKVCLRGLKPSRSHFSLITVDVQYFIGIL